MKISFGQNPHLIKASNNMRQSSSDTEKDNRAQLTPITEEQRNALSVFAQYYDNYAKTYLQLRNNGLNEVVANQLALDFTQLGSSPSKPGK